MADQPQEVVQSWTVQLLCDEPEEQWALLPSHWLHPY